MEYFIIGLLVGFLTGVAISGLTLVTYIRLQTKYESQDVGFAVIEKYSEEVEDEHVSEMDVTVPLVVKEEPKPSAVGDAEVRRRSSVVNEDVS